MPNKRYQESLYFSQKKLEISAEKIRNLSAPAEKGTLIENTFRENLEQILPEKIGISSGFVMDTDGSESKQMDIILYDKMNTPRLFTSDSVQVFPVEYTYACGEVKTKLATTELQDSFKKCSSYKNLNRKAYFDRGGNQIQHFYKLYGTDSIHWKSIFFVLAAESISSSELIDEYKRIVNTENLPMEKRVDSIFSLKSTDNGNVVCHHSESYDLLPSENSHLHGKFVDNSWGFFMNLLLRYLVQAQTEPVDLLQYGGN
ncbi:hypothetical protein JT359_11705 [Candidatus Poribacteria bacterium]|nr:hypothetical protein [Candidatus Poribacteria bacterium]